MSQYFWAGFPHIGLNHLAFDETSSDARARTDGLASIGNAIQPTFERVVVDSESDGGECGTSTIIYLSPHWDFRPGCLAFMRIPQNVS